MWPRFPGALPFFPLLPPTMLLLRGGSCRCCFFSSASAPPGVVLCPSCKTIVCREGGERLLLCREAVGNGVNSPVRPGRLSSLRNRLHSTEPPLEMTTSWREAAQHFRFRKATPSSSVTDPAPPLPSQTRDCGGGGGS